MHDETTLTGMSVHACTVLVSITLHVHCCPVVYCMWGSVHVQCKCSVTPDFFLVMEMLCGMSLYMYLFLLFLFCAVNLSQ